jgi:hypothetical protein
MPSRASERGGRQPARSASGAPGASAVDPFVWRCQRTLARIGPEVEAIVAEHATCYWQRGARRREEWPRPDHPAGRVRWTIDDELVVELRIAERGAAELVVHDVSLIDPLRRALRSGHVRVSHAS